MLREVVLGVNDLVLRLRRSQRIRPEMTPVRVNLGSALLAAPGWINIDASPTLLVAGRPTWIQKVAYRFSRGPSDADFAQYEKDLRVGRFVHHDLTDSIPMPDRSADFIYSSHFLEHLSPGEGQRLLHECLRVLRPGGIVRICVPDLSIAVRFYLEGDRSRFLNYFFTEDRGAHHRHRYMYDFELLSQALGAAGFAKVERCSYRSGRVPDLDVLDNRPDETLFVEAMRP